MIISHRCCNLGDWSWGEWALWLVALCRNRSGRVDSGHNGLTDEVTMCPWWVVGIRRWGFVAVLAIFGWICFDPCEDRRDDRLE